eukprot:1159656-Pelagomonas_calceolata.AAC.3
MGGPSTKLLMRSVLDAHKEQPASKVCALKAPAGHKSLADSALREFQGAIVAITHNRAFAESLNAT